VTELNWLPVVPDWRLRLRAVAGDPDPWNEIIALANAKLDFVLTNALDQAARKRFPSLPPDLAGPPVKLALLGSSTFTYLHSSIRVAGLRRGLWVDTYENKFNQYLQELSDRSSELHEFAPNVIMFALDPYHVCAGVTAGMNATQANEALGDVKTHIREAWRLAREAFHCPVVQQTVLPVFPNLLGNNEHRLPGSRATFIAQLNRELREMADADGIDLVAADTWAAMDGVAKWHDIGLWHRAKVDISPAVAPFYGDLVGRLLAAKRGRSFKCLVMDLDNTLWGGVVGDDGLEGIILGQGSPMGEAYVAFQTYAHELSCRGVILAVCSKNDRENALEPFERHPEMVLRVNDIASFVANWSDKPTNIRAIAEELNIGLDSLVFVDDNPFERDLVRRELPMVAVPEMSDDPSDFPQILAASGYFEGASFTDEDRERAGHYQTNRAREALKSSVTDITSYLRDLQMRLIWKPFDEVGLQRTVQLINKSNQFNLTTRRYTEENVLSVMNDAKAFGLQLRLVDRFGDNGMIAVVIGRLSDESELHIDTWLMSCRVLGRQVEETTLNLIVQEARRLGARTIVGEYIPSKKNGMVKYHYSRLGFVDVQMDERGGNISRLDIESFVPEDTFIEVVQG
jgi:FkbH-like protein